MLRSFVLATGMRSATIPPAGGAKRRAVEASTESPRDVPKDRQAPRDLAAFREAALLERKRSEGGPPAQNLPTVAHTFATFSCDPSGTADPTPATDPASIRILFWVRYVRDFGVGSQVRNLSQQVYSH